jgi:putative ABC transport system permease protein
VPAGRRFQRPANDHLEEVRAIPGVVSAASAGQEPMGVNTGWNVTVKGDPNGAGRPASASVAFISPGYFATMGIPFVRGRDFDVRDAGRTPQALVVNQNFVRKYVTAPDPIGIRVFADRNWEFEIIGVVKHSASFSLRDLDNQMMYVSGDRGFMGSDVLHVRAGVPPATLIPAVEAAVRRVDPNVPIYNVRTIDQQLDRFLGRERTFARLSSTFGLLALALSAVGLYGVMANAVSRRTRELGIRVALGAAPGSIVRLVLNDAALLVALGIGAGLPCAYLLAKTIQSVLFEVTPGDWKSVAAAVVVLTMVAAASAWLPARRAARVDPLAALRSE